METARKNLCLASDEEIKQRRPIRRHPSAIDIRNKEESKTYRFGNKCGEGVNEWKANQSQSAGKSVWIGRVGVHMAEKVMVNLGGTSCPDE